MNDNSQPQFVVNLGVKGKRSGSGNLIVTPPLFVRQLDTDKTLVSVTDWERQSSVTLKLRLIDVMYLQRRFQDIIEQVARQSIERRAE
jgi:hypothetical protein